jgi:hypothetical protein
VRRTLAFHAERSERLEAWLHETGDPLLDRLVTPPPGAVVNALSGRSAVEPVLSAVD